MELFSEVYSCYYRVLRNILCSQNALTIDDIRNRISEEGFGESFLSIIPRLESGTWDLLKRDGDVYLSRISPAFLTPLSALEKSYLEIIAVRSTHRTLFKRGATGNFKPDAVCRSASLETGTFFLL